MTCPECEDGIDPETGDFCTHCDGTGELPDEESESE